MSFIQIVKIMNLMVLLAFVTLSCSAPQVEGYVCCNQPPTFTLPPRYPRSPAINLIEKAADRNLYDDLADLEAIRQRQQELAEAASLLQDDQAQPQPRDVDQGPPAAEESIIRRLMKMAASSVLSKGSADYGDRYLADNYQEVKRGRFIGAAGSRKQ